MIPSAKKPKFVADPIEQARADAEVTKQLAAGVETLKSIDLLQVREKKMAQLSSEYCLLYPPLYYTVP